MLNSLSLSLSLSFQLSLCLFPSPWLSLSLVKRIGRSPWLGRFCSSTQKKKKKMRQRKWPSSKVQPEVHLYHSLSDDASFFFLQLSFSLTESYLQTGSLFPSFFIHFDISNIKIGTLISVEKNVDISSCMSDLFFIFNSFPS